VLNHSVGSLNSIVYRTLKVNIFNAKSYQKGQFMLMCVYKKADDDLFTEFQSFILTLGYF